MLEKGKQVEKAKQIMAKSTRQQLTKGERRQNVDSKDDKALDKPL
jgi:hypothetical protein